MSNSLQPHELQHARPPCPSPTPRVHSNSCPTRQCCHPPISSSVIPFSSCPQSLPAICQICLNYNPTTTVFGLVCEILNFMVHFAFPGEKFHIPSHMKIGESQKPSMRGSSFYLTQNYDMHVRHRLRGLFSLGLKKLA